MPKTEATCIKQKKQYTRLLNIQYAARGTCDYRRLRMRDARKGIAIIGSIGDMLEVAQQFKDLRVSKNVVQPIKFLILEKETDQRREKTRSCLLSFTVCNAFYLFLQVGYMVIFLNINVCHLSCKHSNNIILYSSKSVQIL